MSFFKSSGPQCEHGRPVNMLCAACEQQKFMNTIHPDIYYQQTLAALNSVALAGTGVLQPIKHEGIQAGEIIGYRVWRVIHKAGYKDSKYKRMKADKWRLQSLSASVIWDSSMMFGDINENGRGCHCFKTMDQALDEIYRLNYGIIVIGSVTIWGEVVEHERGYRSQFMKVKSLDKIMNDDNKMLEKLRKVYGV